MFNTSHDDLPSFEKHDRLNFIQKMLEDDHLLRDFEFDYSFDNVGDRRVNHRLDVKGIAFWASFRSRAMGIIVLSPITAAGGWL